ncbi:MauE/DoxX family redox-associated membrane protein [Novosphingobium sp.]|uniref:MauE/DoxX family redox-associated membrane protein n=1 Tax=Novosphingobium sp. TaxID=1874826 RepID=UPI003BAC49AB
MAALVLFCAALLAASALHKALSRERLTEASARLAGVGPVPAQLLLILAGTLELVAAACLLAAPVRVLGGVIAALVWGTYALALARRRGETLDCGCDLAARSKPVSTALVLRAAGLAVLAGIVALLPDAPFSLDAPFAAAGLIALYLGASELLAIPAPYWKTA